MGASFSTRLSESNTELRNRIDAAATKVVLDSSFTDLTKLANEKYCNRLVKKVATIFQQNKDTVDLELLRQKLYDEMQKEKQKRAEAGQYPRNKTRRFTHLIAPKLWFYEAAWLQLCMQTTADNIRQHSFQIHAHHRITRQTDIAYPHLHPRFGWLRRNIATQAE